MSSLSNFFGLSVPSVSVLDLNKKLTDGDQLFLLDVREPEEYVSGHIRGSSLIPLGELGRRLNELPKDSEVMCICATGSRSLEATRALIAAGYHAINVKNGMIGWQMANLPIEKGISKERNR